MFRDFLYHHSRLAACFVGVPAHAVGKEVAETLLNQLCHGGCVDDFLQDQVKIL